MAVRLLATQVACQLRVRCLAPVDGRLALLSRHYASSSENRKYLKSHEYIALDGEIGTVGISDFAQAELGEIVYVELPEVGATVTEGETFGVVESVKAASDVYSPVSGKVVEINEELKSSPGKVNDDPFADGWMMKVKLDDTSATDSLLDESAYKAHCAKAEH
eukprot:SM000034S12699  [mRNA]  locus=s34:311380:312238:+ [translate_table: standard]